MAEPHLEEVSVVWSRQRLWTETARRLKRRLDRARATGLTLAIMAAVLAVTASQLTNIAPWVAPASAAAAAISAGVGTMVQQRAGSSQIQAWTRARSVSEGLKAEVYSYLAGGSLYASAEAPDQVLYKRVRTILDGAEDLFGLTVGVLGDQARLPEVASVEDYIARRVDRQINGFYRPKAVLYQHRARRLRTLGTVTGVVAMSLSALAAAFDLASVSAWASVATTIGASITAHIAAARYDHLILEYSRTAQRLERLVEERSKELIADPAFIDSCEAIITTENQGWLARWASSEEFKGGPKAAGPSAG